MLIIHVVLDVCGLPVWLDCECQSHEQVGEPRALDRLPQGVQLKVLVQQVEDREELCEVRLEILSGGLEGRQGQLVKRGGWHIR